MSANAATTPSPRSHNEHIVTGNQASPRAYDRTRDLPNLLPLWPNDAAALANNCPNAKRSLIARLHTALRAERRRGQCGHWAYDLNRHLALKAAYLAEAAAPPPRSLKVSPRAQTCKATPRPAQHP